VFFFFFLTKKIGNIPLLKGGGRTTLKKK